MPEDLMQDMETPIVSEEAPPNLEEIRLLAYQYWEERGRPEDSPEQDWIRAEHEIASRGRQPLILTAAV